MICKEFLKLLDDEGGGLTPAAVTHASTCPSCGRALERWRAVQTELQAMAADPAPEMLAARVMAAVRREGRERSRPSILRVAGWRLRLVPALAVLLLASLGGYVLWQTLRGGPAAIQQARMESGTADEREAPSLKATVEDRAAPAAAAPPAAAPALPAPAQRRAAARPQAKRANERPIAAAVEPGFAPEPLAAAIAERDAARDEPRVGGGAEGVVAAAPAARQPAAEPDLAPAERVLAKLDAKSRAGDVSAVQLVLTAPNGTVVAVLDATAASVPPDGSAWLVAVSGEGRIVLRDAAGRDISVLHPDTLARLRAAGPPPGTYRLSR